MKPDRVWPFEGEFLPATSYCWEASKVVHVSITCSFLLLSGPSFYGCATVCLSIHPLKDTCVVSSVWQLWTQLCTGSCVRINFHFSRINNGASLVVQQVKNPPAMRETWVRFLSWKDPLEEGMATHSSILSWRISWTEEPGGLQSMGLKRVGHDWVTKHISTKLEILSTVSSNCIIMCTLK